MQRTLLFAGCRAGPAHRCPQPAARAGAHPDHRGVGRPRPRRDGGDLRARSTRRCCGRCRTRSRIGWCASTPTRRRSSSASRWSTTWRSPSSRRSSSGARPIPIAPSASRAATAPSSCARRVVSWGSSRCSGITPPLAATSPSRTAAPALPLVAIASHAFWQQRLGGRPRRDGEPLRLDGAEYTLVGVLPPSKRPARTALRPVPDSAVHDAAPQGTVLPVGHRAPASRRRSVGGDERTARDQPRAVPDLAVVVPGRLVDVEHGGSEDEPPRRRRHARGPLRWRPSAWCG